MRFLQRSEQKLQSHKGFNSRDAATVLQPCKSLWWVGTVRNVVSGVLEEKLLRQYFFRDYENGNKA